MSAMSAITEPFNPNTHTNCYLFNYRTHNISEIEHIKNQMELYEKSLGAWEKNTTSSLPAFSPPPDIIIDFIRALGEQNPINRFLCAYVSNDRCIDDFLRSVIGIINALRGTTTKLLQIGSQREAAKNMQKLQFREEQDNHTITNAERFLVGLSNKIHARLSETSRMYLETYNIPTNGHTPEGLCDNLHSLPIMQRNPLNFNARAMNTIDPFIQTVNGIAKKRIFDVDSFLRYFKIRSLRLHYWPKPEFWERYNKTIGGLTYFVSEQLTLLNKCPTLCATLTENTTSTETTTSTHDLKTKKDQNEEKSASQDSPHIWKSPYLWGGVLTLLGSSFVLLTSYIQCKKDRQST